MMLKRFEKKIVLKSKLDLTNNNVLFISLSMQAYQ